MKNSDNFLAFAEHVKRIRKEAGLSQREMAVILGIGIPTLSKIERGILPSRLSCSVLFRIHQHFGIHPKNLFAPSLHNDFDMETP